MLSDCEYCVCLAWMIDWMHATACMCTAVGHCNGRTERIGMTCTECLGSWVDTPCLAEDIGEAAWWHMWGCYCHASWWLDLNELAFTSGSWVAAYTGSK